MTSTTFTTQRQLMRKNMPESALTGQYAQQQKMLLYVLPLVFAVGGIAFPIGVLLYWTTSNLWTMGQQFYVIRNNPTPGHAGVRGRSSSGYATSTSAHERRDDGASGTIAAVEPPRRRRRRAQQPKKQTREQRRRSRSPDPTGPASSDLVDLVEPEGRRSPASDQRETEPRLMTDAYAETAEMTDLDESR